VTSCSGSQGQETGINVNQGLFHSGLNCYRLRGERAMNLKSLSEHLGLSQTTVSRALAGYSDVAEGTRNRVQNEAKRLGYSPNAAAQRLALGKARAFGIVFATAGSMPADPIMTEFLTGLAESAARFETDVLLSSAINDTHDEMRVYRRLAQARSVDAIIVSSPLLEDARIPLLARLGLPTIVHGRTKSRAPSTGRARCLRTLVIAASR
jgi:LacI family transcriptional regulator